MTFAIVVQSPTPNVRRDSDIHASGLYPSFSG
jgi:hypothetical protein